MRVAKDNAHREELQSHQQAVLAILESGRYRDMDETFIATVVSDMPEHLLPRWARRHWNVGYDSEEEYNSEDSPGDSP
jgi:hypothetical protein